MMALYLFCLGLGGILLVASFFGDADAPDHGGDAAWQHLFSLRNATYFLFVFGAIGSALGLIRGRTGLFDLLIAGGAGLATGVMVHSVFGYIRRTDSAEVASDSTLVGKTARVTLPVSPASLGKIELSFGGQRVELLARPFGSEAEGGALEQGCEVVIVEMTAGTALVSRASMD
jgi:hypothetical protein